MIIVDEMLRKRQIIFTNSYFTFVYDIPDILVYLYISVYITINKIK